MQAMPSKSKNDIKTFRQIEISIQDHKKDRFLYRQ
jgi:hypothetical protein